MVLPLLPVYAVHTLAANLSLVGLLVSAPSIGLIIIQPAAGYFGDRYGRRSLILGGLLLAALSTVGYGTIRVLPAVLALRIVAGAGSGLVLVGSLAAVVDEAPTERIGELISVYTLATNGGTALGPVVGGELNVWLSFAGVACTASAFLAAAIVSALRVRSFPLDVERPMLSPTRPPRNIIHSPALVPGALLAVSFAGAAALFTLLALFLSHIQAGDAGLALTLFALSIILVRFVGRRLPERLGHSRCALVALVVIGIGLCVMAVATSLAIVLVATVVVGIGHGFAYPSLAAAATLRSAAAERTTALGVFTAVSQGGMAAWSVVLGGAASLLGLRFTFVLAAGGLLLGCPLALRLGTRGASAEPDSLAWEVPESPPSAGV